MAVTPSTEPLRPLRPPPKRRVNESLRTWRWGDRIAFVLCWASGLTLCLIAAAIVLYMAVKGLQYLSLDMVFSRPQPSAGWLRMPLFPLRRDGSGANLLAPLPSTPWTTSTSASCAAPSIS